MLHDQILNVAGGDIILNWIEYAALTIEVIAVAIITGAIILALGRHLFRSAFSLGREDQYRQLKMSLGKALLLGLDILVAADVVRTVALEATLESLAVLGLLVLIRTFLSWALVVEIESRWLWQPRREIDESL